MLRNPDVLYQVGCCLRKTTAEILADHGLRVPERGLVTHKGPDYECENCESLWVYLEGTNPIVPLNGARSDSCTDPKTRNYVVELAYPACTEEITPCNAEPGCVEGADGCWEVDPQIGDGKCVGDSRPTVQQETAYIWRARYAIEQELACRVKCCLEDCSGVRCEGTELTASTGLTEGGCAIMVFNLSVTW